MELAERRYDDRESARIIQRALEIQKLEHAGGAVGAGLSLSELEAVARESGIDPALIRRAAAEVSSTPTVGRLRRIVFGNPIRVVTSTRIRGRVDHRELQGLIVSLPGVTGDSGSGSVVGDALLWNSDALLAMRSGRSLTITVRRLHDGTEVRIESNLSGTAGGLFGGLIGGIGLGGGLGVGLGVGLSVLASPLFCVAVPLVFVGSAWLLARGIYALVVRYRRARDSRTLETIGAMIEGSGQGVT